MTYEEVKIICHVRSAIYRTSQPEKKFIKNHRVPFDKRVPDDWKTATDWEEYDPRNEPYEALA